MGSNGKTVSPMKAGKFIPEKVRFPVYIQPKFDGIRCIVRDGCGLSTTFKPIPNVHIQNFIRTASRYVEGFDGELVIGGETDQDGFNQAQSGVMSEGGKPNFTYHVFDYFRGQDQLANYEMRLSILREKVLDLPLLVSAQIKVAKTDLINNMETLMIREAEFVALGYEGVIIRSPWGPYKWGRSSPVEGLCIKIKRFADAEAKIVGFEELYSNQNEATFNATGKQVRSSHQANMVPQNTLGAFVVHCSSRGEFKIGTGRGLTQAVRKDIWDKRDQYLGKWVKYKYQEVGGYEKPRIPIWVGFRDERDINNV